MKIKELIESREVKFKQICKNIENEILNIVNEEFNEYDLSVQCETRGYISIIFSDNDRFVKFHLSNYKWKNKTYVRVATKGVGFTNKEIKSIAERLNKIYEK